MLRVLVVVGFVVVMLWMLVVVVYVMGQQVLVYIEQMVIMFMNFWKVMGFGKDRFQYEFGIILCGIEFVYEVIQKENYFDYIKYKVDCFVYDDGIIISYVLDEFQLDSIFMGRFFFIFFKVIGVNKYKIVVDFFCEQLWKQLCIYEGGFWYKNVYFY